MKSVPGWIIAFIITGLVALGGLGFWYWGTLSGSVRPHTGPVEKINRQHRRQMQNPPCCLLPSTMVISSGNGLEVTLKILRPGKWPVEQLRAGTIDIANAADFVVVERSLPASNLCGVWEVLPRRMTS